MWWEVVDIPIKSIMSSRGRGDDTDPDFAFETENKKKFVYRADVQKRYLQRKKQKKTEVEGSLAEVQELVVAKNAENKALVDSLTGLQLLCTYSSEIAALLSSHTFHAAGQTLPAADVLQTADKWFELFFNGKVDVPDGLLLQYVQFPQDVLVKKEEDFIFKLQEQLREWEVNYSSRGKLETSLAAALDIRRRGVVAMSRVNPDAHLKLLDRLQPPPGSPEGDHAHSMLMKLVLTLQLAPEQIEEIEISRKQYLHDVSTIQVDMAEAQRQLVCSNGSSSSSTSTSTVTAVGGSSNSTAPVVGDSTSVERSVPTSMVSTAVNTLATAQSASILAQLPYRMGHAYAKLAVSVLKPMTAVQNARLTLGCLPYLPDQLCEVLSQGKKN